MGSYNYDFVDYANFYQIKVYEYPVGGGESLRAFWEEREKQKSLDDCPFPHDGLIEDITDYAEFEERKEEKILTDKEIEQKREHSLQSSVSRTMNIIYEYAQNNVWEWFVTFTFKRDTALDVYDYDSVMKSMRKWLNYLQEKYYKDEKKKLQYLLIPEQHKDGAWHFHGFFANSHKLHFDDSGKEFKGRKSFNLREYKKGFSVCEVVDDTGRISSYILKYVTKDLIDKTDGKTRFIVSRGLQKASHDKRLLNEVDMQRVGVNIMRLFENGRIMYKKIVEIPNTNNRIVTYFVSK